MNNTTLDDQVNIVQNYYTVLFWKYYLTQRLEQLKIQRYKLQREIIDDYMYIEWEDQIDEFNYIKWENIDDKHKNFEEFYKICQQCSKNQIDIFKSKIQDLTVLNYLISKSNNEDEWLFIFHDNGELLTVGSRYQEIIVWAEKSVIGKFSNAEDLLKAYWGTGFPGFSEACQQSLKRKSLITEYTIEDIEALLEQNLVTKV